MANETAKSVPTKAAAVEPEYPVTAMGVGALVAGWLVPGLGHIIQKRWIRGVLIFVSVVAMFALGLGMEGKVYGFNTGDLLEMLGFVCNVCCGGLYFLAGAQDWGQGNIHRAVADYGTKFIIVAGLLNIISAIDAYHIGIGKKK
jgi:peptidoglycan/LPS O-acetylase OafA/YrhL